MSLIGVMLALLLTRTTFNMFAMIAFIMLMGLVVKNGILLVDFANQARREEGKSITEALVAAGHIRLRPILMTTAAMVLGAVPLALAEGAGAESRQQIGWVIVGGMTLGTLLTLFVLPALYAALPERRRSTASAGQGPGSGGGDAGAIPGPQPAE